MKIRFKIIITLTFLCFLLLSNITDAQADWVLAKDKNDIKVFTRKLPNANLKDYRVESVINATANEVLDKLLDFEDYKNWFCKHCAMLFDKTNFGYRINTIL